MDDDCNADRRCCQVTRVRAVNLRQSAEHVAVADHNELPWLPIARTAGPAADLEDVVHHVIGQWVGAKLTHSAQIAQEGDPVGADGICHWSDFFLGASLSRRHQPHRIELGLAGGFRISRWCCPLASGDATFREWASGLRYCDRGWL